MKGQVQQTELHEALSRLQRDPSAIAWPQRRKLAEGLGPAIQSGDGGLLPLVHLLAQDVKPEVRQRIAELLPMLGEDDFAVLAARLAEDANAFVRTAAQRALDRRRRGQNDAVRRRRGIDQVLAEYTLLEREHGRGVARKAQRLGERLYDLLVGATVHDLRAVATPALASASSLLAQLREGSAEARITSERLTRIVERLEFLVRLLEDLRSYVQPLPLQRSRIRVAEVVAEAVAMARDHLLAAQLNPAGVTLKAAVPQDIVIRGARHQLVVAFTNLIKNACESIGDSQQRQNGQVEISTEVVGGEVRVILRDSGRGISPEDLAELRQFVPGRTTRKNRGTGFGLPIARRTILTHGGSFEIDSVLGQGTTVTLTLPVNPETEEEA